MIILNYLFTSLSFTFQIKNSCGSILISEVVIGIIFQVHHGGAGTTAAGLKAAVTIFLIYFGAHLIHYSKSKFKIQFKFWVGFLLIFSI